MTRGTDHELSSVAFTIANGGMTAGLKVYIFLTSAAVDLARKRAVEITHCVKARRYSEADLIEGVKITGASAMHERIKAGAATLTF